MRVQLDKDLFPVLINQHGALKIHFVISHYISILQGSSLVQKSSLCFGIVKVVGLLQMQLQKCLAQVDLKVIARIDPRIEAKDLTLAVSVYAYSGGSR